MSPMAFEKRNIALCIVLSIVTCGIYGIYWWYVIARVFYNSRTPNALDMSPGLLILLNIVTCGFFGIYVFYKWGKQSPEIFYQYGQPQEDKSILYLVLAIFGLQIINIALIQNDFNSLADLGIAPQYPQQGPGYPPPQGGQYPPPPYGAQPQYPQYPQAPQAPGGYPYAQQPPAGYQPQPGYQPPAPPPPPPPPGSPYGNPYGNGGQNPNE